MRNKYFLITITILIALIFFFYGKIILAPNHYLFAPAGDGFTAYFNTSWHIEFDNSNTQFTGNNYPYGEHTVFTEYRLLLSNSIKALGNIFPAIKKQNVAITNLSIIFSILLCGVFIWLIFKELGVKKWLAVSATIGITFLAPQVGRFDNHLTLAYLNCFPMTWYFLMRFFKNFNVESSPQSFFVSPESTPQPPPAEVVPPTRDTLHFWHNLLLRSGSAFEKRVKQKGSGGGLRTNRKRLENGFGKSKSFWTTILFLNNLGWLFTHSYLGLLTALFSGAFWLVWFFKNQNWKNITNYLHFVIQTFAPLLLFMGYVNLTDIHEGRTKNPLGFFLYNSEPDDIFIPHHPPLRPLLQHFFDIQLKWEGWAYVGLLTTLILTFLIFHFIKKGIQQKHIYPKLNWLQNEHLKIAFPASLLCLIFAFGYPFKAFPELLEWFPIIKNFRTTGRFGWIFYFVSTVSITFLLHEYLEKAKTQKSKFFIAAVCLLPLTYLIEGFAHHYEMSYKITQQINVFDKKNLNQDYTTALSKIPKDKYQAIIPLPYYHCGAEDFRRPIHDLSSKVSKIFSYHSQIPLMAFDVGRTSIMEGKKMIQTLSPTYYKKLIINDLPSDKPFLIVISDALDSPYEKAIKDRANTIYGTKEFQLKEISKEELLRWDSTSISNEFENRTESDDVLFNDLHSVKNNTFTTDTTSFIYQNDFEDQTSSFSHFSKGAFEFPKRGETILAKFSPNTFNKEKTYRLSTWFYNGQNDALNDWFRFIVEERNPKTGEFKYLTTVFPEFSEVIDGDWSLVEMDFKVDYPQNEIRIITIGKTLTADVLIRVDGLLIREKGVDVFQNKIEYKGANFLKKNNHIQKSVK